MATLSKVWECLKTYLSHQQEGNESPGGKPNCKGIKSLLLTK